MSVDRDPYLRAPARRVWTDDRWFRLAACKGMDPELFFPGVGESRGESVERPVAVCAGCPVRCQCLAYGLWESMGIYGGKPERERRRLRNNRGALLAVEAFAHAEADAVGTMPSEPPKRMCVCEVCGDPFGFDPKRNAAVTCGPECSLVLQRANHNRANRAYLDRKKFAV